LLRDCCGVDSVSDDAGLIPVEDGRLAAGRPADLRVAGRDFDAAARGLDVAVRGVVDLGLLPAARAVEPAALLVLAWLARLVPPDLVRDDEERVDELRGDVPRADGLRDELRDDGREAGVRDDGRVGLAGREMDGLRALVVRRPVVRLVVLAGAGLADDIVLAAAVSAFAAVIMALVAVFIDLIADDIVCADAVALVAAAVILVAADVTLVAAEETPRAAVAGVAELRLPRVVVLLRAVAEPERDAVDRDAVLRVDRDPALRVVVLAAVPVEPAELPRVALAVMPDDLEVELDLGRLAVPLDALRLTDLLRAVLAELRRVAARVVD